MNLDPGEIHCGQELKLNIVWITTCGGEPIRLIVSWVVLMPLAALICEADERSNIASVAEGKRKTNNQRILSQLPVVR